MPVSQSALFSSAWFCHGCHVDKFSKTFFTTVFASLVQKDKQKNKSAKSTEKKQEEISVP